MKFKKKSGVLETSFEAESILLDVQQAMYFSVEGSGQWIWNSLETAQSLEDLSQSLMKEFELPNLEMARKDVQSFLNELEEKKLIEVNT